MGPIQVNGTKIQSYCAYCTARSVECLSAYVNIDEANRADAPRNRRDHGPCDGESRHETVAGGV